MNCGICNRPLTVEESINKGIGPICWAKIQSEVGDNDGDQDQIRPYDGGDVILERVKPDEGTVGGVRCNVPRTIYRHSPTGYNWGYGGSGPADLALNILLLTEDMTFAGRHYQDFKRDFLAGIDQEAGGRIGRADIDRWISGKKMTLFTQTEESK